MWPKLSEVGLVIGIVSMTFIGMASGMFFQRDICHQEAIVGHHAYYHPTTREFTWYPVSGKVVTNMVITTNYSVEVDH